VKVLSGLACVTSSLSSSSKTTAFFLLVAIVAEKSLSTRARSRVRKSFGGQKMLKGDREVEDSRIYFNV
jgi:hypothetical protein